MKGCTFHPNSHICWVNISQFAWWHHTTSEVGDAETAHHFMQGVEFAVAFLNSMLPSACQHVNSKHLKERNDHEKKKKERLHPDPLCLKLEWRLMCQWLSGGNMCRWRLNFLPFVPLFSAAHEKEKLLYMQHTHNTNRHPKKKAVFLSLIITAPSHPFLQWKCRRKDLVSSTYSVKTGVGVYHF